MINSKYELACMITQDLVENDILNTIDYPDIPAMMGDVIDIIMQRLNDLIIVQGDIMPDRVKEEE